ncbi:MAG TPA: carboxypeptidase-like regulatory domain-containing protein, partial [Hanamia sp.]|nr:carboxypeptidase-like regulatory domain-containing protein [Hanamia sp.]
MKKKPKMPGGKSALRRKVLLSMKLIFLLTFVCCMQVSAKVFSQDAKIDLTLKNTNITKALHLISQKSEYRFLYNNDLLPKDMTVNIVAKQETVPEIIKTLLANSGLTSRILPNKLIAIGYEKQEIKNVTGIVTDSTGHPLAGVSIQVKGTNIGTTTDADGNFSIDAPDNATLVISYVGYIPREITVNGQISLNIILRPAVTGLSEVVVTALGIKRQARELGYAT